jgi:hypothetical protein
MTDQIPVKYRKRPVVIEAMQLSRENIDAIFSWMSSTKEAEVETNDEMKLCVKIVEGDLYAQEGDFVVRGTNGEFYLCKPDVFKKICEKAE